MNEGKYENIFKAFRVLTRTEHLSSNICSTIFLLIHKSTEKNACIKQIRYNDLYQKLIELLDCKSIKISSLAVCSLVKILQYRSEAFYIIYFGFCQKILKLIINNKKFYKDKLDGKGITLLCVGLKKYFKFKKCHVKIKRVRGLIAFLRKILTKTKELHSCTICSNLKCGISTKHWQNKFNIKGKVKFRKCKRCNDVSYCSTRCQKEHWNRLHRYCCTTKLRKNINI